MQVGAEAKLTYKNIHGNYFLTCKQHMKECIIMILPSFGMEYIIISSSKQNWYKTHIIWLPWQRIIAASSEIQGTIWTLLRGGVHNLYRETIQKNRLLSIVKIHRQNKVWIMQNVLAEIYFRLSSRIFVGRPQNIQRYTIFVEKVTCCEISNLPQTMTFSHRTFHNPSDHSVI